MNIEDMDVQSYSVIGNVKQPGFHQPAKSNREVYVKKGKKDIRQSLLRVRQETTHRDRNYQVALYQDHKLEVLHR